MKKSTLFLTGMAALLLSFGLILTGCGDSATGDPAGGGGGDKKAALVGTWVKEGDSDEKMKYEGRGGSNDPLYFQNEAGSTLWSGQMVSYDGTTATVGDDHNSHDPHSISFTATISGSKLTIDGLTDLLEHFNGTYTKEDSGKEDPGNDGENSDPSTPDKISDLKGLWVGDYPYQVEVVNKGGSYGIRAEFSDRGNREADPKVESYDGTTLTLKDVGTCTATIAGDVLTISGLTGNLAKFNRDYTKLY
jgi:hypothetical protein